MKKVVLTGAGFVGTALRNQLKVRSEVSLCVLSRFSVSDPVSEIKSVRADVLEASGLYPFLSDCDAIIHTAARVHHMSAVDLDDELDACRRVNTAGTLNLARQAASSGAKRFVFLSSIKVCGERTLPGKPFREDSPFSSVDPYAVSKHEAEQGLKEIANETGMEVVIIRPPLVYGPGVKANFLRMMKWLDKGIPLPFGGINNRRSLVALDNLVDFVITCLDHPKAANQVFHVSDDVDLSTPDLLHGLSISLGCPDRVFSIPTHVLKIFGKVFFKSAEIQRLCDSLQVDNSKAKILLGWQPPLSVESALKQTADWYLEHRHDRTAS